MMTEQAQRERDKRLRRALLSGLDGAKRYGISGDLDGITLRDVAQTGVPDYQGFEDEQHAIGLIRDLKNKGLIEEAIVGLRRGTHVGLSHMRLKITARGSQLLNETLPVDPDIDDERVQV